MRWVEHLSKVGRAYGWSICVCARWVELMDEVVESRVMGEVC